MNTPIRHDKQDPQLRDLAAGAALSIAGRRGSVVRVLRGRAWITQEGDAHDYVVPAGTRFCAARDGHLVVSAVADDTRIAIYRVRPLPSGDWSRNRVRLDPDFTDKVRHEAHRAQALYIAQLLCGLWRRVRNLWTQRAPSRRHDAVSPAQMRRYHCG
ncbi:MAG: DUF2917 domain-containing protein [Burkholderiales bacterium]|nr:DUF2917 domain-containing protein [Burkholderiales bacterium]